MTMVTLLCRGCETLVVNSPAAVPADNAVSAGFAVPRGKEIKTISVAIRPATAFTTLQVDVQVANNDVEAEYQSLVTSTVKEGDFLMISPVVARFIRVKKVASTGGTGLVVGMTCN
jgi:hypothetical protein